MGGGFVSPDLSDQRPKHWGGCCHRPPFWRHQKEKRRAWHDIHSWERRTLIRREVLVDALKAHKKRKDCRRKEAKQIGMIKTRGLEKLEGAEENFFNEMDDRGDGSK